MKAVDKEDRAFLAELNHASVHTLYIICSLMKQWIWGLNGGHVEDGVQFPALTPEKESERKWLLTQGTKVERHAWDCLALKAYQSGKLIPNGLHKTINAKVEILNDIARDVLPNDDDYRTAIVVQTGVFRLAMNRLRDLEKHNEKSWRYLAQTLDTFCKRITSPEDAKLIEAVHAPVADLLIGMELVCDWRAAHAHCRKAG